jgi:CRP/FNR family transcriptional regulator/CRP/FNR family cyclic AMP-dependent transcriptional regulator
LRPAAAALLNDRLLLDSRPPVIYNSGRAARCSGRARSRNVTSVRQGATTEQVKLLARLPLFSGLESEIVEEFARRARPRRYQRGNVIFHKDDPGSLLYVIVSGAVKVGIPSVEGKDLVLNIISPGESFGELALFDDEPRSASAEAIEDTQTLTLQRADFLELIERYPKLAIRIIELLARRLRSADALAQDACLLDLPGRLARRLLELAETYGQPGERGAVVLKLRLTQSELASLIGATRVATNRQLQRFQALGIVSWENQRITLKKPDELRRLAVI